MSQYKTTTTSVLEIAYYEHGPPTGWPVVLSHGFPYDIHAYDEVVPLLTLQGARVIVPYLRGHGPTRFLSSTSIRSCQQAALGSDLISLLNSLDIKKAILGGFDWGGVASCVATALWPERVSGLVSYAGYDIIDREAQKEPVEPLLESVMWYQHLFQSERGRRCLTRDRKKLCKLLWTQWSPTWPFTDELYDCTATSFENEDFVDVVISTYRHSLGNKTGDPELEDLERRLALKPKITVPCITLDGTQDPLKPGGSAEHADMFQARHERREVDCGHALPFEAPEAFAKAILDVHQWASGST